MARPVIGWAQDLNELSTADLYRYVRQFEQSGEYGRAGEAYRLIAERDLAEIENLDKAIRNYIEAEKMFSRAGDSVNMFQTVADLGRLYCVSEYYLEAISLFERVLAFAESRQDTLLQARIMQQIGEIHMARRDIPEAVDYLNAASQLNLKLQDTLLSELNQMTIAAIWPGGGTSRYLPDSVRLELSRFDSIRYRSFLPSMHLHAGLYNMHRKRYKLAQYYFREGLKLAEHDPFVRRALYRQQAACYEQMGDPSMALQVMKSYAAYNDSLNMVTRSESIEQAMARYRDIERQTELQDLARDRNITMLKSRMQRVVSYALLVGIVIMLIGSYIIIRIYQQRLSANQIIAKQNEEINQRKIRELESNLKIETMSSMLQGQEVERERIARDLHDSLGGLLSTVKLHFDALQATVPDIAGQAEYDKAYNLLDNACNEVRTISNNMQPGALVRMGLIPALRDLINRIESKDTPHIEFIHFGPLNDLPTHIVLHIFRIVQELLFNAIKHAGAGEILIQVIRNPDDLEIMVEDDGRGYDTTMARKGMGTENVAARVNYLKGEISVHSEPGVGTTTTITIPMPERPESEAQEDGAENGTRPAA